MRMHMASMRVTRDGDRFLQVQSHALLRRGFGTSVPFIVIGKKCSKTAISCSSSTSHAGPLFYSNLMLIFNYITNCMPVTWQ